MTITHCAIIILAAGSSSRMGRPKQLLPYNGKSLLGHIVDVANDSEAEPVIVVLGANAALMEKEIDEKKVHITVNEEWQEGMASSVRCGIQTLVHIAPTADAAIIMVCDQPYVSASLLNDLIRSQYESGKPIVACDYGDVIGPPALFHKKFFPELMELKGDAGAKKIIQQNSDEVTTIPFAQGKIDIDTKENYDALKNSSSDC